jgi:hypothetical protein
MPPILPRDRAGSYPYGPNGAEETTCRDMTSVKLGRRWTSASAPGGRGIVAAHLAVLDADEA